MATLKAVALFSTFIILLLSRGELNVQAIQKIIGMGNGIIAISHREGNNMDDLLTIVRIMAERGSADVLPRLPKTVNAYPRPIGGDYTKILEIFSGFIRGPLVNKNHLQKFVGMETDVMTIARLWRVNDIITVVGAVAEHGTTAILAALQKGSA